MNYYEKYLKYKNKYLYLKGGKPVEQFTGLELPNDPEDIDIPAYTEEQINGFFNILNHPRGEMPDNQYYLSIQSPLRENLIQNRINLDNLRAHLMRHLRDREYVNVASLQGEHFNSVIWARKNGDNIQLYDYAIDNLQQTPQNSGLALFLAGYHPAQFLFQYLVRG